MPRSPSSRNRITEAALSGLTVRLVTEQTPLEDAIAQIHAESTDPLLLSRVAGHQLARADTDERMAPRYRAAAELLVAAGGTDREAGLEARERALRLGGQRPPDAWRPQPPRHGAEQGAAAQITGHHGMSAPGHRTPS